MSKSLKQFFDYWIYRYLLVTELYMVEQWERVMIHIVFFMIFTMISLFNTRIIVATVSSLTKTWFVSNGMDYSPPTLHSAEL